MYCAFSWSWCSLKYIKNDLVKFLPEGAVGDQEEMAQLDGEQVLCCGPEAPASFTGEQWGERGHAAVHPQQKQLADPHVQPAGRDPGHLSGAGSDAMSGNDATSVPDVAKPATPTLVPMTSLTNPFLNPYPNPYPDETMMETQLNSSDPEQPLVWPALPRNMAKVPHNESLHIPTSDLVQV